MFANLKHQDVVVVGALHPEHLHRLGMAWNSGYDMVLHGMTSPKFNQQPLIMIYFSDENMQKKQTNVHRRIFLVQDISTHFKTGSSKCRIFCLHWNRKKSLECTEAFSTFFNKAMAMSHYVPTTESASCSAVRLRGHRRKIMDVHPAKNIR